MDISEALNKMLGAASQKFYSKRYPLKFRRVPRKTSTTAPWWVFSCEFSKILRKIFLSPEIICLVGILKEDNPSKTNCLYPYIHLIFSKRTKVHEPKSRHLSSPVIRFLKRITCAENFAKTM